jgi:outer membrane protein, heavy metal efflux system
MTRRSPAAKHRSRRAVHCLPALLLLRTIVGQAQAGEVAARASQLLGDPPALEQWLQAHHPEIGVIAARTREAAAATRDARLIPNPLLTLAVGGLAVGTRNPDNLPYSAAQNYQVTVAETIEIGKRGHRIQAADLHADAVRLDGQYTKTYLVAQARENLARVVYLHERHRVLEERLETAKGIVDLDNIRLERGDVSGIDHDRLLLDVVNVEREIANNSNELAAAHASCRAAFAAPCQADVAAEVLDTLLVLSNATMPAGFEPSRRPDVMAQRQESAAQREQAQMFGNKVYPDPTVGFGYLHDHLTFAGNQPNTLGVFVTLPLPIFDPGQHQRTQALERAAQLEGQARRSELNARSDAEYLIHSEKLMIEKLALLKERALPLGVDVLTATETAYRLGQVSMTDLLLARRQRAELALDLIDTRYALFQVRSQLLRVLGLASVQVTGSVALPSGPGDVRPAQSGL